MTVANPALENLLTRFTPPFTFAQVLIRAAEKQGFSLIHVDDAQLPEGKLLRLTREELRHWADRTDADTFRPQKGSPSLARGWIYNCSGLPALDDAFQILYPGCVADWHANQIGNRPVLNFEQFAQRQTGMYGRIRELPATAVVEVAHATCDRKFCLKQRLWTAPELEPDTAGKSIIPCLEPCAVLLEMAREAAGTAEGAILSVPLSQSDLENVISALRKPSNSSPVIAEGDIRNPANPRKLELLARKLETTVKEAR